MPRPRQNQTLCVTGSAVQPSAGLPSSYSFHGEVFSSGRLLLSIPLVQLCAAHTPKPRRARFRANYLPIDEPNCSKWNGCFAFVLLRMMQTGEEPVKVSLRLASLDL